MDILYRFKKATGESWAVNLRLHPRGLTREDPLPGEPPAWAALGFEQCAHCPWRSSETAYCPLAARLALLLDGLEGLGILASHEPLSVEVQTPERRVQQDTTAQRGLSALMGLVVATSGCPHTLFLKPMARFHLPFASEEETVYRVLSMWRLASYFQAEAGGHDAWAALVEAYTRLHQVNTAMARRLRAVAPAEVALNALTLLDLHTKALPVIVAEQAAEIRYLFAD